MFRGGMEVKGLKAERICRHGRGYGRVDDWCMKEYTMLAAPEAIRQPGARPEAVCWLTVSRSSRALRYSSLGSETGSRKEAAR